MAIRDYVFPFFRLSHGRKLDVILMSLSKLREEVKKMSAELDTLTTNVTHNSDVIESAIVLIGNIKSLLDAAGTDPAKLQALSDTLAAEDDKLAAAVVAGTPAAPTPPTV